MLACRGSFLCWTNRRDCSWHLQLRETGMSGRFAMKLLSLIVLVPGVVAAQTTPRAVQSIPAIAKAANGAIVTIITANNDKPITQGTGFLVTADGVIVTNYHVIETGN